MKYQYEDVEIILIDTDYKKISDEYKIYNEKIHMKEIKMTIFLGISLICLLLLLISYIVPPFNGYSSNLTKEIIKVVLIVISLIGVILITVSKEELEAKHPSEELKFSHIIKENKNSILELNVNSYELEIVYENSEHIVEKYELVIHHYREIYKTNMEGFVTSIIDLENEIIYAPYNNKKSERININ